MIKKKLFLTLLFFSTFTFGQTNKCDTEVRSEFQGRNTISMLAVPNQTWTVPVVFHVLYHLDKENIPDSLVLGLLSTQHDDFLNLNIDLATVPLEFQSLIGNSNINFVLARKLPDSTPTSGIIRKFTNTSKFKLRQRKTFEQSPIINNKSYLNVYICNVNTNAYTPSESNPKYDGIVINYKKVFNGSRTLTHETGHWLGLRHIFQGNCKDNDEVQDTPAQRKHSFYCPNYPRNECGHSTMFMNYMDYSSCRCFFTIGQVEKMKNYIITYKIFNQ